MKSSPKTALRPAATERGWSATIDHRATWGGPITEALVFPSTEQLLVTAGAPRIVTVSAWLQLSDGTAWLLEAVGHAWTSRRLVKAAALLLAAGEEEIGRAGLQRKLAAHLSMPSLTIAGNIPPRLEPGLHDCTLAPEPGLASALEKFFASVDPQARLLAMNGAALDLWSYNYLAHRERGRYRKQFAATFPLLAPLVAHAAERGDEAILMRRAIDAGAPLVREFSRILGVAPRVIRHLAGKQPSVAGEHWPENVQYLARILDALPIEFLPGDDPWQWSRFNLAVSHAQKLSKRPPWKSPSALAWLRECAGCWMTPAADCPPDLIHGARLIASVDRLEKSLADVLILEAWERNDGDPSGIVERVSQIKEELMLTLLRKGRLGDAAARFDREVAGSGATQDLESRVLLGKSYWPLFLGEHISRYSPRKAVPLVTEQDFLTNAQALNICLWKNPQYGENCRRGKSFILAFLDTHSGKPYSAAEIAYIVRPHGGWELRVLQHRGFKNEPVAPECGMALASVLHYCSSKEVRDHIERGLRLISDIEKRGSSWARLHAESLHLAPALRAALGDAFYESALHRVCSAVTGS